MPITTTTTLPPAVQQSFSYKLLLNKRENFIYNMAADKQKMPSHGGDTIRMKRYNSLDAAMVPLGNTGITPPADLLTAVHIDAKMQFYGKYIILNEQVSLQSQDPVLNAAVERLGHSLRKTEDQLTRDMLAAGAGFVNCVGGVNGDNPTELSRTDVDDVVRTMLGNDAITILDSLIGQDRFGTSPVRDSYVAMCSTDLSANLERVAGFTHKNNYPTGDGLRSEYGTISSLRFFVSSLGQKTANASNKGADLYNISVTGMEAYSIVEQDEYSSKFIYRPAIYDGPLMLNASAAYKMATVPVITNDEWILNLRCTLS